MLMQKGEGGYTLIESIMYLAVTSALLLVVLAGVSSRQSAVQYSQSIRNLESLFMDVANDVKDGLHGIPRVTCSPSASGGLAISPNNAPASTDSCVFLGKIISFGEDRNPNSYKVYTVVGSRTEADSSSVSNSRIGSVRPTIASPGRSSDVSIDTSTSGTIDWGSSIDTVNSSGYAVGFLNGLREFSFQTVTVFFDRQAVADGQDSVSRVDSLNAALRASTANTLNSSKAIYGLTNANRLICFDKPSSNQKSRFIFLSNNDRASFRLEFDRCV